MTMTEPDTRTDIPITLRRDGTDRDVWCIADPTTTVSQIAEAGPDAVVLVDGVVVAPDLTVASAGVRSGSVVEVRAGDADDIDHESRTGSATLEAHRLAGPRSGEIDSVPHERPDVDADAPPATDDGVIVPTRRGLIRFAHRRPGTGADSIIDGVVHRPPTIDRPDDPPVLRVPDVEPATTSTSRLSWAMVLAPIPVAIIMMTLLGPRALVFAAMSPTLALGRAFEDKWRTRRARRQHAEACRLAGDTLTQQFDAVVEQEHDRRWRGHRSITDAALAGTNRGGPLWVSRPAGTRFGIVTIGYGATMWTPDVELGDHPFDGWTDAVQPRPLPLIPVEIETLGGRTVGVIGSDDQRRSVARSIVGQLVTATGPAHLRIVILTADGSAWEFAKWIPHARTLRRVEVCSAAADVAAALAVDDERHTLFVIDDPRLIGDSASGLPMALAADDPRRSFLALAHHRTHLPWTCRTTVAFADEPNGGLAEVTVDADEPVAFHGVRPTAPAMSWMETIARGLSPLTDPETTDQQAALPSSVSAEELWPLGKVAGVLDVWDRPARHLAAPIGIGAAGPVSFDLVSHGPHALVAGTTGSGKSELLRTIVAGIARHHGPERVNFVLVDYKGGGAFDVLEQLPHTVAVVTDLDDSLAGRALRSLRAELHHRELVLREHGVSDIADLPAPAHDGDGLPRLVVVIDEFATLAAELPDFMNALIDIAQRGRSLGLHLILATQRPAGVVDAKIRANTNARICLRVQDDSDSLDVIGERSAARLPSSNPGRAIAKLGDDRIVFQAASVSGPRRSTRPRQAMASFIARPVNRTPRSDGAEAETTIAVLGRLLQSAAVDGRREVPRSPWQQPLAADLDGSNLGPSVIGLADDPDRQRHIHLTYDPTIASLALIGAVGSGITTALSTCVRAAATGCDARSLHCYALDLDGSGLAELGDVPHVGEIVAPTDLDGRRRLAQLVASEQRHRRNGRGERPHLLVVVDGVDVLRSSDDPTDRQLLDLLGDIARDGPALGMTVLVGARSDRGLGSSLLGAIARRLIFSQNDPSSYLALGLKPRDVPALPSGRCIDSDDGLIAQIARRSASPWPPPGSRTAPPIPRLPEVVRANTDLHTPTWDAVQRTWTIPIGLDVDTLETASLELTSGDRIAVTGQRRTGRTTLLRQIVAAVSTTDPDTNVEVVTPRHNQLADDAIAGDSVRHLDLASSSSEDVTAWLNDITDREGRTVVVIDDADRCTARELGQLLESTDERVSIVVAARSEAFKNLTGWCRGALRDHVAVMCRPMPGDGDMLRARVAATTPDAPVGRAALVSGSHAQTIQLASVDPHPKSA